MPERATRRAREDRALHPRGRRLLRAALAAVDAIDARFAEIVGAGALERARGELVRLNEILDPRGGLGAGDEPSRDRAR